MARVVVCHGGCGVDGRRRFSHNRREEGAKVFAERDVREREGWRGRKGEKGGQKGGKGGRRGAVGVWGGRGAGGRGEKEKKSRRKLIKFYRKIKQQCWTI